MNLVDSTKQVFDRCAPEYLKIDEHWGCDLDIIRDYVERFERAAVLELGTGHAWHLVNLFLLCRSELGNVVGLDYSEEMLQQAQRLLERVSDAEGSLKERVALYKADLFDLPVVKIGNRTEQWHISFDVVLLLNNTLGNLPGSSFDEARERRREALAKIKEVLKPGGYLILSVNNAERLYEEEKYGDAFEIDLQSSNLATFDLVVRYKQHDGRYYSHWFSREEILRAVYEASFKIVEVEERRKRIVVVAQKRRQATVDE